jgi:hypothetical protein
MKSMVNLLPPSYRRQQMVRLRVKQWGAAIAIMLLAACAWHCYELRTSAALSQQLQVLEREHAPTQRTLRQLVQMRAELDALEQQVAVARALEEQRSALALLGIISRTTRETGGRLRVTKMELTNFQASDDAAGTGAPAILQLSGVSIDHPAVWELLDGLQDTGIFSRVELLACTERQDGESTLRDYELRCEF